MGNPKKSSSVGRAFYRNRSGVVELVGKDCLLFARVENGVTKFSPKKSHFRCWPEILDQ